MLWGLVFIFRASNAGNDVPQILHNGSAFGKIVSCIFIFSLACLLMFDGADSLLYFYYYYCDCWMTIYRGLTVSCVINVEQYVCLFVAQNDTEELLDMESNNASNWITSRLENLFGNSIFRVRYSQMSGSMSKKCNLHCKKKKKKKK